MEKIEIRKWDAVDYLKTEEDMAMYLQVCMEEACDDAELIAAVLDDIARAKSMLQSAKNMDLDRDGLLKHCPTQVIRTPG